MTFKIKRSGNLLNIFNIDKEMAMAVDLTDADETFNVINQLATELANQSVAKSNLEVPDANNWPVSQPVRDLFASVHPVVAKALIESLTHVHSDVQPTVAIDMIKAYSRNMTNLATLISSPDVSNDVLVKQLNHRAAQVSNDLIALSPLVIGKAMESRERTRMAKAFQSTQHAKSLDQQLDQARATLAEAVK